MGEKKPVLGIVSFTCDQGCQFTILFIDKLFQILKKFDVQYFHLLKEKNRKAKFDVCFVEGAVSSKKEVQKLKEIRKKSKVLVALGACACHGGVPAMRNFIENKELEKYVYNQGMLKGSIPAAGIEEFVNFLNQFLKGKIMKEFEGPVCAECPRQGTPECFLRQKKVCLGPVTHGGCSAICTTGNFECMGCRGPRPKVDYTAEINLFKSFGISEKEILEKLNMFKNIEKNGKKNKS